MKNTNDKPLIEVLNKNTETSFIKCNKGHYKSSRFKDTIFTVIHIFCSFALTVTSCVSSSVLFNKISFLYKHIMDVVTSLGQ